MKPKSHTLFHFTKSIDTLKIIIKEGFWPRYCLEDVSWLGYKEFDFIAYPMVCFCDIPLSRADDHVNFYGEFGIGLTREWAEINKINPVMYISSNNHLPKTFRDMVDAAYKLDTEQKEQTKQNVRYLMAHCKPTEGNMIIGSDIVPKQFYQESEWRYVPKNVNIEDYLLKEGFQNVTSRDLNNTKTKENCSIKFSPKDIKYIFVKSDSDIPEMINFIQSELDHHPNADLKLLMSRVTSLESIRRDL